MRTTLKIDGDLIARAQRMTGIRDKSAVVKAALETLVSQAAVRRLISLQGAFPDAKAPRRRRPIRKRAA